MTPTFVKCLLYKQMYGEKTYATLTHLSAYLTIKYKHRLFVLLSFSKSTSFFSMDLVPAVLRCREVGYNLVLFQDVFLIAISWNVWRAEELPKILIPSSLVLITVSHLRDILFGRWADWQTAGIQQWVSKFCREVNRKAAQGVLGEEFLVFSECNQ